MDAITVYSLSTFAWLTVQGLPLVLWPSFVASLLTSDYHVVGIAIYFARALGIAQIALGLLVVLLTGLLPLGSPIDGPPSGSPYAVAGVLVSTFYHGSAAFYSYGCYYYQVQQGLAGYALGCAGSGTLACLGLWCLMFGTGSGHISRRTGGDKRTSNFPFNNSTAYVPKKRF